MNFVTEASSKYHGSGMLSCLKIIQTSCGILLSNEENLSIKYVVSYLCIECYEKLYPVLRKKAISQIFSCHFDVLRIYCVHADAMLCSYRCSVVFLWKLFDIRNEAPLCPCKYTYISFKGERGALASVALPYFYSIELCNSFEVYNDLSFDSVLWQMKLNGIFLNMNTLNVKMCVVACNITCFQYALLLVENKPTKFNLMHVKRQNMYPDLGCDQDNTIM